MTTTNSPDEHVNRSAYSYDGIRGHQVTWETHEAAVEWTTIYFYLDLYKFPGPDWCAVYAEYHEVFPTDSLVKC